MRKEMSKAKKRLLAAAIAVCVLLFALAAAAALFSGVHWAMNGSVKQVVIAFAFRLAALLVRQIFRRDNAFYICAGMHFVYNLMVFFVISI